MIEKRKDFYAKKQTEFEKVVENVCNMLYFQLNEYLDNLVMGYPANGTTNAERSLAKQTDFIDVIKDVITTPTIVSAASNFLVAFGEIATVVTCSTSPEAYKDYVDWLGGLLTD